MQMLYRYGDEWGFQGTLYSELFIEVYLLGVLMFSKSNTELADYDETKGTDGNSLEICRSIGLCMLAISILPQLYHDVIQIGAKLLVAIRLCSNLIRHFMVFRLAGSLSCFTCNSISSQQL